MSACNCPACRRGPWCADGKRGVFERGNDNCQLCHVLGWKHSTLPRCEEKR